MNRMSDRGLVVSASILGAGFAFLLFGFRYPPSVDFPQHVAQLSAWAHFADPAYGFAEQFELNRATPYLLGYILARPFVPLVGALAALKLVLLLAAVANVGAFAFLLRTVEQDPWLCLLGYPLTFGFTFYLGFVNFLLATPLIIIDVTLALRYARQPRWQRGVWLAAVLGATFLNHGFAFAIAILASFVVYIGEGGPSRWRSARSFWPFVVPTLVAMPWLIGFGTTGVVSAHPNEWAPNDRPGGVAHLVNRIFDFPATLLSFSQVDVLASAFGFWLIVVAALSLGRYTRLWHRWALYVVAMGGYLLCPFKVLGVALVYERFAAFVVPGMILLAGPTAPVLRARTRRALVGLLSLAWLAILVSRQRAFNAEASDFDAAIANLPPRLRVRPLIDQATCKAFPDLPLYHHFPAYYQAERGGYLGYSFARYSIILMRYRAGVDPGVDDEAEWETKLFDAAREVPLYDCFVVRADHEIGTALFRAAPRAVNLLAHTGKWWVYGTSPKDGPP